MYSLSSLHSPPNPQSPPSPSPSPPPAYSFPSLASLYRIPLCRPIRPLRISNIDAAQPYDYESKLSTTTPKPNTNTNTNGSPSPQPPSFPKLKIGIVGFGNYGQFLAKTLSRQGHTVLAHSRSDYSAVAASLNVSFFQDPHDLCEAHPDVLLLCTSILSTESVLRSLPLQRLKRNTLFVDVLSVKEFPRSLFLKILPLDFDILCTHPMFGPESGKFGWKDLPFLYDRVRIGKSEARATRCDAFIDCFRREGCRMVNMSCAEHDKYAAGSQFITHMMGRVLQQLALESTPINTKGYESLLTLVENTSKDSFELFYGLFMYNKNAMEQLQRVDMAFETVKKQLFGHLHELLRGQLFEGSEFGVVEEEKEENSVLSESLQSESEAVEVEKETLKVERK